MKAPQVLSISLGNPSRKQTELTVCNSFLLSLAAQPHVPFVEGKTYRGKRK